MNKCSSYLTQIAFWQLFETTFCPYIWPQVVARQLELEYGWLNYSSTYTLFLDGKEDLAGKLKNSATVLVTTHMCMVSCGLSTCILLLSFLGISEESEGHQDTCPPMCSFCWTSWDHDGLTLCKDVFGTLHVLSLEWQMILHNEYARHSLNNQRLQRQPKHQYHLQCLVYYLAKCSYGTA